jgi:hypothetical protein
MARRSPFVQCEPYPMMYIPQDSEIQRMKETLAFVEELKKKQEESNNKPGGNKNKPNVKTYSLSELVMWLLLLGLPVGMLQAYMIKEAIKYISATLGAQ